MKFILTTVLFLFLGLVASNQPSLAARTGPVEFQMLASCAAGSGNVLNYNAATGIISCTQVTGETLTWSAPQTFNIISGYLANVTTQAGTTYTLASTDCGTMILFSNAAAVTVTLPNSLAVGCEVALQQYGANKVSVTAASGATLFSPHSYTGTFARWSVIGVAVDQNAGGVAADWTLTGDGS